MPSGRFSRLCVYVSRLPLSCCLCFFVVENGLGFFFFDVVCFMQYECIIIFANFAISLMSFCKR